MDTAAWPLAGDIVERPVRRGPGRPCRITVRAICVRRAALFERSEFQHASVGKRRSREPFDANLFRRIPQTAASSPSQGARSCA